MVGKQGGCSGHRLALTECDEGTLHKSKTLDRALRSNALFVLVLVLVLSPPRRTVLVLVLESIQYSNPTYWSASYREPPRSTIDIAAVRTAIEYEYRCTEYRFAEYEYDEIRCEARSIRARKTDSSDRPRPRMLRFDAGGERYRSSPPIRRSASHRDSQ